MKGLALPRTVVVLGLVSFVTDLAYDIIVGASALPASLLTGALWKAYGPLWALGLGAALAGLAAALLGAWEVRRRGPGMGGGVPREAAS
jgi:hypothetical protein